jgi:hypothetical protein
MLSKLKRISISIVILAGAAGCGGNAHNNLWNSAQPKAVTGITLKENTFVAVGGTETLYPIVTPVSAYDPRITWNSLNTAAATVDENGTVTGIAEGTAKITATTVDGGFKAVCTVTVSPVVSLTAITVSPSTLEIYTGGTGTLSVSFTPTNATNQNITWSSSDETVATVAASGLVSAVKKGSATITATSADGNHTSTCAVTVKDGSELSALAISSGTLSPSFDAATVSYSTAIDSTSSTFSVTATTADPKASVTINGNSAVSGTAFPISLSTGTNSITIIVTGEDSATETYSLSVTKNETGTAQTVSVGSTSTVPFVMILSKADSDPITFPVFGSAANDGTASVSSPFYMAQTETTYELWETIRDITSGLSNTYTFINNGYCGSENSGNTQQPVTQITYEDAIVWCNKLTEYCNIYNGAGLTYAYIDGSLQPYTDVNYVPASPYPSPASGSTGFRLPTNQEWEFCARYLGRTAPTSGDIAKECIFQGTNGGASTLTAGYFWTPGNYASGAKSKAVDGAPSSVTEYAVYYGSSSSSPTSVVKEDGNGNYRTPNYLGIYDMSGNIQEMSLSSGDSLISNRGGQIRSSQVRYTIIYLVSSYMGKSSTTGFRIARTK